MAAKEEFGLRPYWEWAPEARRPGAATKAIVSAHPERIGYHRMTQYLFARQWSALKEYANARGVFIIGDMPIYVSRDSVEMWSEPELFKTAPDGSPASVAGTPPDNFSATGQYWGNPIYDWGAMATDGYSWWKGRMPAALTMYDLVRLDHFRGFEAYWEVPFGSPDCSYGSWTQGPGMAFFDELKRDLGELPLIAEDLGCTVDVVFRSALTAEDFARAETEARVVYENPDVTIASTPDTRAQAAPPAAPKPPVR